MNYLAENARFVAPSKCCKPRPLHSTRGWETDLMITSHVFGNFDNLGPHHNQHDYFWFFPPSFESQLEHITDSLAVGIRLNGYKSFLWEIRKCGSPFTKQTCFWVACSQSFQIRFQSTRLLPVRYMASGLHAMLGSLCWDSHSIWVTNKLHGGEGDVWGSLWQESYQLPVS